MIIDMLTEGRERGRLDGHFLIAMPGALDENFARTVVYICAHSSNGAMGLVLNRPRSATFSDLLVHLKLIDETEAGALPDKARRLPVQSGGPVETGRGFILHSDDYASDGSIPVSDAISLTGTLDIMRAISDGQGPLRAVMMLGYAGWGTGQLEREIAGNGWLTCPANEDLIFDPALDEKYDKALALLGIEPSMLSSEIGHA